jgi:transcriptional regulator with XRE-family HTH domain
MKHRNERQNRHFALWLGRTREAVPLTQEQLAEYLHVSQATISYWETEGRLWMEPHEIVDLARLLRVDPVKVAEALGYPTQPAVTALNLPFSPVEWMRQITELNAELVAATEAAQVRTTEAWAERLMPPEDEKRGRNDRSG